METLPIKPWNVLIKGIILYLAFESFLVFSNFNPAFLNIYQLEILKRERFPSITAPKAEDKALDVGILDTMFASHIISSPKRENEYRIIILGDSSIWGAPLPANSSLASEINALNIICQNKRVVAYNLGYPLPSAIKDMMILDKAMYYKPDLVIWGVTMYSLTTRLVEEHPLLETEPLLLAELNSKYHFLKEKPVSQSSKDKWINANFKLSRTLRYQTYGLIQLATATDQVQEEINSPDLSLKDNIQYVEMSPPTLSKSEIFTNLVNYSIKIAKNTPVIIINEPILIVKNKPNSDLRYNSYYPRWAYDQYRNYMNDAAAQYRWQYLDYWDSFMPESFADSPLHLNRKGERMFAKLISPAIQADCLK